MNQFRYILEPYKGLNTRFECPVCKKKREFTRYIDTETGQHIGESVGKCNRTNSCGYHYTPKQYFEVHGYPQNNCQERNTIRIPASSIKPVSFIDENLLKRSLCYYNNNNFVIFLDNQFGKSITDELVTRYSIGSSKHWNGATVFWQIDISGKIRTGKIMLYNQETGKRVKQPFNHITWIHSLLRHPDFCCQQCFYGENLLKDNNSPVAIVESEKTAVISSLYLPQFIWLATSGKDGLNSEKCKVLEGRNVVLYPDLHAYEAWDKKASTIPYLKGYKISDLLENGATDSEKKEGLDLADYLIEFPVPKNDNGNIEMECINLMQCYSGEYLSMVNQFNNKRISSVEFNKYNVELSSKLKASNIQIEDFTKHVGSL